MDDRIARGNSAGRAAISRDLCYRCVLLKHCVLDDLAYTEHAVDSSGAAQKRFCEVDGCSIWKIILGGHERDGVVHAGQLKRHISFIACA